MIRLSGGTERAPKPAILAYFYVFLAKNANSCSAKRAKSFAQRIGTTQLCLTWTDMCCPRGRCGEPQLRAVTVQATPVARTLRRLGKSTRRPRLAPSKGH
jgi:hypothetical protein